MALGALEKEHRLWDGKSLGFGAITQLLCNGMVVLVERGWFCCGAAGAPECSISCVTVELDPLVTVWCIPAPQEAVK